MASLLALLSSVLWGTADFHGGRLSKKHTPIAVLGCSQVLGLVFGIFLIALSGNAAGLLTGPHDYLLPGIFAGVLGYFGLLCLYAALASGSMGVVSPISALSAVVPLTFAAFHGEKLTHLAFLGVCLALIGAFCASGPELKARLTLRPILLSFGAAAAFGTALTFISIGSRSNALMTMVTMRAATLLFTIVLAIKFRTLGGFSKNEYPILIFMGVADFLANLLLGVACSKGSVSIAMVLGSMYPIATAALAFKFLKERLHRVQYFGVLCAVSGVALISAF